MTEQRYHELQTRVADWFAQRLPAGWLAGPAGIDIDRDEIVLVLPLDQRTQRGEFRENTRDARIKLAREAEEAFGRKISWGTVRDGTRQLFTIVRTAVTAQLAMPERRVLDTLIGAGVAADRSDAVAWCIRLVGQHEADWLRDLGDATAATPTSRPELRTQI